MFAENGSTSTVLFRVNLRNYTQQAANDTRLQVSASVVVKSICSTVLFKDSFKTLRTAVGQQQTD